MKVILIRVSFLACLALGWFHGEAFAEFEQPAECQIYGEIKSNVNPSFQHINCLLTHAALEEDVPPEIVKGVATQESGEQIGTIAKFNLWSQFSNEGEPKIASDGGVGIMQITNQSSYDSERLKYDIYYNIQTGVKILSSMYDIQTLPKIKDSKRDTIESWYFPVMAYNGIKPKNSPLCKSEHLPECPSIGVKNIYAYQEKVFSKIEEYSLANDQDLTLAKFPFHLEDFNYDSNQTKNIEFLKKEYILTDSVHPSSYFLKNDDKAVVIGNDVNLRQQPGSSAIITKLPKGSILNIDDNFKYDQDSTLERQYVWYPVSIKNQGLKGYISSAYLMKSFIENKVTKVSVNTDKSGSQSIGTPIKITATSEGSGNPEYRFYLRDPDGNLLTLQPYGTINTVIWTPQKAGTYQIIVHSKDKSNTEGSTYSYEARADMSYQIKSKVTKVSVNTDKSGSQPIGTPIKITATSEGSGNPEYRFYLRDPDGNLLTLQPYGTINTVIWTPQKAGTYQIIVHSKDKSNTEGSTYSYEARADMSYTIK
ncbi:hypothetical protein CCZ20_21085 [Priestia aryabhattai]|uniref:SH3 domain-containing protein n=1 Tax=Priestia aryabhattai TaxID=412384 RepID=UPI000B500AF4|nr:SH3 domain-containing protein [Priestia aryabhattai]OVE35326.1 hypothetical protein CCZ20_21085 [Priestia aryabhattai]